MGMNTREYGYYKIIYMNFRIEEKNNANKFFFTVLK